MRKKKPLKGDKEIGASRFNWAEKEKKQNTLGSEEHELDRNSSGTKRAWKKRN